MGVAWLALAGACTEPGVTVVASGTEARAVVAREVVPASEAAPAVDAVAALTAALYAIRDVGTGALLFIGRVLDPSSATS